MNTGKIVICIVLLNLQFQLLWGQDYYFKHYKVEDGLSHNTVLSSLQDKKGFMWFGTKNGLNRFDGFTFKLYQNNPDNPKSLKGNYVECVHEFDNSIWVGTDNGLFKYNERFENFDLLEGTTKANILDIENDDFGNLWFVADNTLNKHNVVTNKTTRFSPDRFFHAISVIKTLDNEIWAVSPEELFHYSKETNSFQKYILNITADSKKLFRINKLFNLDNRTILIGTQNHGVVAFDIIEKRIMDIAPITTNSFYVRDFALRGKNELWVATESGIHIYDLGSNGYTNLRKDYNNPYAISDNAVYSLTVDKEGGIWAGTFFGGIDYHPKQYTPFEKYFPKPSQNSINGNAVREIKPDKYGNLWIGTEDAGLNKYNPKTGLFTNFTSKENGGILSYHNIHALLPTDNYLWIGMFDHGLDILDIKTNKVVKHYNMEKEGALRSNFVFALYESTAKEIYAITTEGVLTYNEKRDYFDLVEAFPENHHYTCFLEDNSGVLWAGTYWDGLYYYNPKTKEKGCFKYDELITTGISHNHINSIFQDSDNNIWVTTENGLNLLDLNKKTFRKYSTKDGFPSNVFYSILEDDMKNLWVSTSNGLVEFNVENDTKKTYTKANGLLGDQFNYNSAYKDPTGKMYFGCVNGLISFNPNDFLKNSFSPPIHITGLQIDNQEVRVNQNDSPIKESITLLDHLTLLPSESSFSLNFSALSYTAPENTEYWYKMEGLNKDWTYLHKDHKVDFTKLAAGNYSFKVKSINNSGVWGKETSALKIKVLPVFWKSNLAYVLYTFLVSALIFLSFKWFDQKLKKENTQRIKQLNNRKEKEIYQAKIEFFTNISHEIRTPLTLIKSPLEKLLKIATNQPELKENLSIMDKNTSRLLNLANQLLDFRKTELEGMNLTFVETNITSLVKKTHARFSQAIKDKNIDFELTLSNEEIYAFVDSEALKKILSNLFNNAIKYAAGKVIISLDSNEGFFELTVKNDGNLIPTYLRDRIFEPFFRIPGVDNENRPGTGIGLSLAQSLTELHKGNLKLDTSDGLLNIFVLSLPIHQEKEFKLFNTKKPKISEQRNAEQENEIINGNKSAILLVEDNEDLLDFIAKDLANNYIVRKAVNAEIALEILKEENIQLVITDVMMPGMDGFTFCEKIKTSLETSHIPVVLLTAKSTLNSKIEGLESGADAYIAKPFSMEHLKVQAANLIHNRKHIMEHYASSPLAHIRSIASTKTDETFIKKLDEIIYNHMADPDLNVETLAEIMHMSRSTLYRKIKDISNLSPNELINITRLKKSAELLKTGNYKIFEVADIVGYNSPTSFGRNFQKQFNMTPSDYINGNVTN